MKGTHLVAEQSDEPNSALVPSSMTVVIPAYRIKEILNVPKFGKSRAARESGAAPNLFQAESVDLGGETGQSPTALGEDANPDHREDFMRLAGAATRTPPQAD